MTAGRASLLVAAQLAARNAYAPYSGFPVGAALSFADGSVVTGANVENASYGLSLCAEAAAVARAMNEGRRDGLMAVAVSGPEAGGAPITPCGRCRQMLYELARVGGTDPMVWSGEGESAISAALSELLPRAFGPDSLRPRA